MAARQLNGSSVPVERVSFLTLSCSVNFQPVVIVVFLIGRAVNKLALFGTRLFYYMCEVPVKFNKIGSKYN